MSKAQELIGKIDTAYEADINEAAPKKFVSFAGGKKHVKLDCPPGFTIEGNTCRKMTATEILAKRKAAKKAARTARPKRGLINRTRAMTMKKRKAAGL